MLSQLYKKIRLLTRKGKEPYSSIYKIVGFYPNNPDLYKQAFLHKSQSIEDDDGKWLNNERLEFLGDAILSAVVADIVYKHFENKREGFLTNTRSKIVSRDSMNRIGLSLGIEPLLRYSVNTSTLHESHNSNMLGNALEALIGAIYLDQGFDACYRFIRDVLIKKHIDIDKISETEVNFKSNLIEWDRRIDCRYHLRLLNLSRMNNAIRYSKRRQFCSKPANILESGLDILKRSRSKMQLRWL